MNQNMLNKIRSIASRIDAGPIDPLDFDGVLTGFSGEKLMAWLHSATALLCGPQSVYLEIGVFQGLTLISTAARNPDIACFGIDNFSLFNEGRENLKTVEDRMKRLGVGNATVINLDFEEALHDLGSYLGGRKVGVFFVDGAHDYRSQLVSLLKGKTFLAEDCVIVIDDSNYAHVRQANADFLRSQPEFALLFEAYTPGHMANLQGTEKEAAAAGWWNGVNVMVRDREHLIERRYPREESKQMYFDSHDVFRHEFSELAFPALKAAQDLLTAMPEEAEKTVAQIKSMLADQRRRHPERFRHQNTSSAGLPQFALYGEGR
jgi:hypothetical protein